MPENVVNFGREIRLSDIRNVQSQIQELVEFRGYDKVTLDFTMT